MTLTIRILGLELLQFTVSTDDGADNGTDPGDWTAGPVGFAPSHGDQRYAFAPGVDEP